MNLSTALSNILTERVILITGAGGAIGSCAARTFAAQGASVILLGRSQSTLEKTYDEIMTAGDPQPAICPMDLEKATPEDYQNIATMIEREFGHLDGLLHTAATLGSLSPIEHTDPALWSRVLKVNITAPMLLTRACLPLLKSSTNASILFSTSELGQKGRAYWGAYGITHAAIENLTETLTEELDENTSIRVNCIDPGPIRSRLRALAYPGEDPNSLASADSVISAYLHLMGPHSLGIKGQRLKAPSLILVPEPNSRSSAKESR